MILGFQGLPRGLLAPSWKQVPKKTSKDKITQSCFGSCFGLLCPQIDFICIFCVSIFVVVFGIAFERPPVPILRIWKSFQGAVRGHFEYFFADATNFENATFSSEMLGLAGVGLPFLHHFC